MQILKDKLRIAWEKNDRSLVNKISNQIAELSTPEALAILVDFEDETGIPHTLVPKYFIDEEFLFKAIIGAPHDIDFFLYHLKFDIHEEYEPATNALIEIGARATNRLLYLLEETDDESLKHQIVKILAQVNDPRSLETLVKFAKEKDMCRFYLEKHFKNN